jgi:hypothetical protein
VVPISLLPSKTETLLFASAVPLRVVSFLPGTACNGRQRQVDLQIREDKRSQPTVSGKYGQIDRFTCCQNNPGEGVRRGV